MTPRCFVQRTGRQNSSCYNPQQNLRTLRTMDIREIAKRAKVSTATVSRTINRVPTVSPQLAKRVWSVIEELGYYPNTQARALVSGRSRIFGLIISEITNPFFPEIVQVFERGTGEACLQRAAGGRATGDPVADRRRVRTANPPGLAGIEPIWRPSSEPAGKARPGADSVDGNGEYVYSGPRFTAC
jgi:Bacterial regulatory proteins, lacI family